MPPGRRPGPAGALEGWAAKLPTFEAGTEVATRKALNSCLTATADLIPGLVAGAADLTGNTGMQLKDAETQSAEHPGGRQLYFGIREHAMGAAMTGMAAHGGILPVGGTFFCFSDYMRGAVRLAALSRPTSSTRGPTTRWGWARTGPPTSRSSTWRRCGPCPGSR